MAVLATAHIHDEYIEVALNCIYGYRVMSLRDRILCNMM